MGGNKVLGITGGIGSGKSVVSHLLNIMNIPVYNCDDEAKHLNNTHPEIRKELIALVGGKVYNADGVLNKGVLASFLFKDSINASQVNSIIHPRVKEHFIQWKAEYACNSLVGIESAILFESGFSNLADKIVVVYAPEKVRIQRAMLRDNASEEAVYKRIASQMRDEDKCRLADYIVKNYDDMALIPQIFDILALLPC